MATLAAPVLKWLMDRGIEPHIPVWDKSRRADGTFSRPDFTYDKGRGLYVCPGGKTLKTTGKVHEGRTLLYRARKFDCDACPLKRGCCPKAPSRKVPRDIDEDVRDHVRALANTEAFETSRRARKEGRNGLCPPQTHPQTRPPAAQGPQRCRDEILLAATAQNLRKLAVYAARSPPGPRVHCRA